MGAPPSNPLQIQRNEVGGGTLILVFLSFLLLTCESARPPPAIGITLLAEDDWCCTAEEMLECQDGIWCNGEEYCDGWGGCLPADYPVNCDDGDPCTDDYCVNDEIVYSGYGYGTGHCEHVCVPSDTCLYCCGCDRHSDCNDGDACTNDECDFDTELCTYSETSCDDDNFCTDDSCDTLTGCVNEWISGCCFSDSDCNDLLHCTADDCDELRNECSNELLAGFCLILSTCYDDKSINPENMCETCLTLAAVDDWTPLAEGTPCEAEEYCSDKETCDGFGNCVGEGGPCYDDFACTHDTCDHDKNECLHPVRDGACLIHGSCYDDGDAHPDDACLACRSNVSQAAWSPLDEGAACDDGLFCTAEDRCSASGVCQGSGNPCAHAPDCSIRECDETLDTCHAALMAGYCLISGACYVNSEVNPENPCRVCLSEANSGQWTNLPAGTACDDGDECTGDDTCDEHGECSGVVDTCSPDVTVHGCGCDLVL